MHLRSAYSSSSCSRARAAIHPGDSRRFISSCLPYLAALAALAVVAGACSKRSSSQPEMVTSYEYDPLTDGAEAHGKQAPHVNTQAPPSARAVKGPSKANKSLGGSSARHSVKNSDVKRDYIVQIGAFTKRENAEELLKKLKSKHYPVFIKTLNHEKHGQMFLVRLSPYEDRFEADRQLSRLKDSEHLSPILLAPENGRSPANNAK